MCCVCQGLRGFDRGQVSSVAQRLVPWPIHKTSSTLRGGLHPKKPTHTQRCKPDQQQQQKQYFIFLLSKQLLLLTKTWLNLVTEPQPWVSPNSYCLCLHICLCTSQETVLLEWVNPTYLDISYQEQIQEEFEDSSEIQLKDFLKVNFCLFISYIFWSKPVINKYFICWQEEKFKEVSEALQLAQIQWIKRNLPNKR